MKDEVSLANFVDKAAHMRAAQIMDGIKRSVMQACEKHWRPKDAGEAFIGTDVRNVLAAMSGNGDWRTCRVQPTKKLVDSCRAAIINDLLNGLPKIRELMNMKIEEASDDENS